MYIVSKQGLLACALAAATLPAMAAGAAGAGESANQADHISYYTKAPGQYLFIDAPPPLRTPGVQAIPQTGNATIPEPPVYLMLLIGVGLVGLVARRESAPPKFGEDI